jgi:hypothetical protein
MAIANSYAAGISSAQVIGRQWRANHEGWTAAKTTGDQAPAILFLGG